MLISVLAAPYMLMCYAFFDTSWLGELIGILETFLGKMENLVKILIKKGRPVPSLTVTMPINLFINNVLLGNMCSSLLLFHSYVVFSFFNSRTWSMPVVPSRERVSCGVPGCDVSCERRFLKRHYSRKHPNQQIVLKNAGFGQGGRWRSWIKQSE